MYKFFIKKRKTTKIDEYKSKSFLSILILNYLLNSNIEAKVDFHLLQYLLLMELKLY